MPDSVDQIRAHQRKMDENLQQLILELREFTIEFRHQNDSMRELRERTKDLEGSVATLKESSHSWDATNKLVDEIRGIVLKALVGFVLSGAGFSAFMLYLVKGAI